MPEQREHGKAGAGALAAEGAGRRCRRESLGSREARRAPRFEIPISMVDVVFLLLIFFMVTARFKREERKLDLDLPTEHGPFGGGEIPPEPINVYLLYRTPADPPRPNLGWNWVNQVRVRVNETMLPGMDEAAMNGLLGTLRSLAATGTDKPIQIFATRNCPFKLVVLTMDFCKRLNFTNLRFVLPLGEGGSDFWQMM